MGIQQPLAERMRPKSLDDYLGQKHLVAKGAVLRNTIESGRISSMILWGPPGVGKTTLAQIISKSLERPFFTLSAVNSGVKDVRDVLDKAKHSQFFDSPIRCCSSTRFIVSTSHSKTLCWLRSKTEQSHLLVPLPKILRSRLFPLFYHVVRFTY